LLSAIALNIFFRKLRKALLQLGGKVYIWIIPYSFCGHKLPRSNDQGILQTEKFVFHSKS